MNIILFLKGLRLMYQRYQRWMLIINNRFLSLYDYNFLHVIEKIRKRNSKICGSWNLILKPSWTTLNSLSHEIKPVMNAWNYVLCQRAFIFCTGVFIQEPFCMYQIVKIILCDRIILAFLMCVSSFILILFIIPGITCNRSLTFYLLYL